MYFGTGIALRKFLNSGKLDDILVYLPVICNPIQETPVYIGIICNIVILFVDFTQHLNQIITIKSGIFLYTLPLRDIPKLLR